MDPGGARGRVVPRPSLEAAEQCEGPELCLLGALGLGEAWAAVGRSLPWFLWFLPSQTREPSPPHSGQQGARAGARQVSRSRARLPAHLQGSPHLLGRDCWAGSPRAGSRVGLLPCCAEEGRPLGPAVRWLSSSRSGCGAAL